jgi:hypothetical protein
VLEPLGYSIVDASPREVRILKALASRWGFFRRGKRLRDDPLERSWRAPWRPRARATRQSTRAAPGGPSCSAEAGYTIGMIFRAFDVSSSATREPAFAVSMARPCNGNVRPRRRDWRTSNGSHGITRTARHLARPVTRSSPLVTLRWPRPHGSPGLGPSIQCARLTPASPSASPEFRTARS